MTDKECSECGSSDLEVRVERNEKICNSCGLILPLEEEETEESNDIEDLQDIELNRNLLTSKVISDSEEGLGGRESRSSRKHLMKASKILYNTAEELEIDYSSYEEACELYKEIYQEGFPYQPIDAVAVACLDYSSKKNGKPLLLDDLAEASGIKGKKIKKYERRIMREFNLEVALTTPFDYLPTIKSKLELSENAIQEAKKIITETESVWKSTGKSPVSVACASVYIALKGTENELTQQQLTEDLPLAGVTLRNSYQILEEELEENQKLDLASR